MTSSTTPPLPTHVNFMISFPQDMMQQLEELGAVSKTPTVKLIEQIALNYTSPPVGTAMVEMPDGKKSFVNASILREKYEAIRDAASMHGVPKGTALYNAVLDYIAAAPIAAATAMPDATPVANEPAPAQNTAATTMAALKKRTSPKFQL